MSKPPRYVLGIDLGTSGPKVALISTEGEVAGVEAEPNRVILLPGGGAEQDPHEWWSSIKIACRRLLDRGHVPRAAIAAVSCTAQWSGTVAVDEAGEPLMNAVIWMDSRGSRYVGRVTGGPLTVQGYSVFKLARWLRLTAGVPTRSGKDPLAHILFIKHEHPEVFERTFKFLEPKDYINLRLTGAMATSVDTAALLWLADIRDLAHVRYDRRLLACSTLTEDKLPEIRRAMDVLAPIKDEVADELGLPRGIPVIVGTPDVHSATIGSGAVRDYEPHLYVGTSSWLTCHVPFKKTDIFHNIATLPSAIPGRYLVVNEQETAGACLTYLRDNILYPQARGAGAAERSAQLGRLDELAASVPPGSDKLIFTPWLYGERTPVEDHAVRASLFNQSLRTTQAHLARAVLEGVAYNSRWLLGHLERFVGRRMGPIRFIGGGAHSAEWCRIFADVLDRTIEQVEGPIHANLRGAAFLAAAALDGPARLESVSEHTRIAARYEPRPENRGIYDELFACFLEIYRRNKKIYARLNRD